MANKLPAVPALVAASTGPAVDADGKHFNKRWGYLSRCGVNDKSQLMRQIEKYADVYTSRVANFLRYSPFVYFRCARSDKGRGTLYVSVCVLVRV